MSTAPAQIKYKGQLYKRAMDIKVYPALDKWLQQNGKRLADQLAKVLMPQVKQAFDIKYDPADLQRLSQWLQWFMFAKDNTPPPTWPTVPRNWRPARVLELLLDDIIDRSRAEEFDPETGEPKPEFRTDQK